MCIRDRENIVLRKISQTISKQILSHLEKMAKDDAEKYNSFWKLHGKDVYKRQAERPARPPHCRCSPK